MANGVPRTASGFKQGRPLESTAAGGPRRSRSPCVQVWGGLFLLDLCGRLLTAHAETNATIYFLVGIPPKPNPVPWELPAESYVLPLTKPEDIAFARGAVGTAWEALNRVAPGADGINRNYYAPGFPAWSWHVTELVGFGEYFLCELMARPSRVEEGPEAWAKDGFVWEPIVKELGPVPLFVSARAIGSSVEISWSGLGTNALYSVESADSPVSTNWTALVTGLPDGKTNQWTTPRPEGPARYYRVRAELPAQ